MMRLTCLFLLTTAFVLPAHAQAVDHSAAHGNAHAPRAPASVAGEVRKIDPAAKKITLKHGPIPNLDMPAMTMVFRVQDAALLDKVKAGDRVTFTAEKIGEQITVTRIERAAN